MFDPVFVFFVCLPHCTDCLHGLMAGWLDRSGCLYFQARKRACLKGSTWTSLGVYVHVSSCFVLFIIYVDMPADMPPWLVACLLVGWLVCLRAWTIGKIVLRPRKHMRWTIFFVVLHCSAGFTDCTHSNIVLDSICIYKFAYLRGDLQWSSKIFQLGDMCGFLCLLCRVCWVDWDVICCFLLFLFSTGSTPPSGV